MSQKYSTPFENIALSLSGGGYRAAAFHLGSMSYLDHAQWKEAPLIRQLAVLSTISGGTITGVKYALCQAQEKPFGVFFKELYQFLESDTLLPKSLEILNDHAVWKNKIKQQNLINAFAQVYHTQLLDEKDFGILLDKDSTKSPEVVFNSTDLENQLPFRFQKSDSGIIGHGKANIPGSIAREIRLADIVAASSCFPGGFEPLLMYRDFAESESSPLADFWKGKSQLRLMDGGVVDNQGIESIMLFEKRKSRNDATPFIGTFIISDVAKKEVQYPAQKTMRKNILLNISILQYNVIATLFLIMAIVLLWFTDKKWVVIGSSVLLTLCSLWLITGLWATKKFVDSIKDTVSQESTSFIADFNILRSVKLKYVVKLLSVRLTSLGRLADVFLKRIRDLNYKMLFGDKHWKYRIRTNYIYHLKDDPEVSETLRPFVMEANEMGTTLWFPAKTTDSPINTLDALVITGQAAMCHNLIAYIEELKAEIYPQLPQDLQFKLDRFQKTCRFDFERFNREPQWLLESLLP